MSQIDALVAGESTFPFHSFDEMEPQIEAALGDGVAAVSTEDRDDLLELGEYDVVVDYLTDSTLTDDQRDGLLSFVENGGGYLGVHCASDLTSTHDGSGGIDGREEPFPELRELVGGHFLDHPEQSTFGVDIVADHPVTEGVSDFSVFDEPYQVAYDADRVQVLARMDHPDLDEDYPVVWVREHGAGRVCYVSLGHTEESLEHPECRRLLRNAARWVAGE